MTIISIILILGALHGVLLALFLLTNHSEARVANRYLAALVLLFSIVLLDTELFINEFVSNEGFFQVIIWPREFLFGPLLYFYVRELIYPNRYKLKDKQWLHFIPALLQMILIWSLLLLDNTRIESIVEGKTSTTIDTVWSFIIGDFEDIAGIFHTGIYLFLSFRLLQKHQFFLQDNYSYIDKINLNWLRFIVTVIGALWFVWVGSMFILNDDFISLILDLSIAILIYALGYIGLKHPIVYKQMLINEELNSVHHTEELAPRKNQTDKYQKSALSSDQSQLLLEELERVMKEKKLYLDSKLSLPMLSKELDLSANYLSQIINEQKQQNFFDFVNSYRIEDAKRRMLAPKNINEKIITIAMDSGFNSKSSFYTAFRKATGLTPKQFKDSKK